ncbi:alpha/beta hydrolase [Rhodococcus pseudokoreensis]|uniref:Alpha/beta hydrolase n=1 Tax=Rhodococcus pseudokoreensis TaxID=2811421 RepID=A0A974WDR2_9NOCA|nr:alpha/beta hydrolase [Rhodococcus pseudokoreensis]QSE94743.1 alpha/beta hydrolase [Rhodococcus pseudokoreensis]
MASTQSLFLRDLYTEWLGRMDGMDLPTMRDLFEEWHLATIEPSGVTYEEVDAAGVPAVWADPVDGASDRVLVFTHGGGFVVGSRHSHRKLAGHLAKAVGARALVIDYRRAPEHRFPAQIDDAVTVHGWLLDQGFTPEHIANVGDSAGGNLAVSTPLKLAALGKPLPAAVVALSPWLDMELSGETLDTNDGTDALVKRAVLQGMIDSFLSGPGDATDPFANPLLADYTGFPPVYISVGGHETLLDDARRLAELTEKAEIETVLDVVPEQQHVFHFCAGRAPEADDAIARIAAWLRPKLGLS